MGVKTFIHPSKLPDQYQHHRLIPTIDGVMATTYLLDDIYVLKLFEQDRQIKILENEVTLLSKLHNLPLPKVIDRFKIDKHEVIIYTQMKGESISFPTFQHIKEIAIFLKSFHIQSQNISISCKERFQRPQLKQLIISTKDLSLMKYFCSIDLTLKSEGVIHGDLFPDNCKFQANRLSGVYDFSDICMGDFHFDLAVVAVGWCFEKELLNKKKVQILLEHYTSPLDIQIFLSYIRYALLYYATSRFIAGRNHTILLKRLEQLT